MILKTLAQGLLDFFYPNFCVACDRKISGGIFCKECFSQIEPLTIPVSGSLFAAVRYQKPMSTAIHRFKYRAETYLASHLSQFLIELSLYYRLNERIDCVIPVPLYSSRQRERGFNQSELMARELAAKFSLPVYSRILIRVKNTPSQTTLSEKQRMANVARAFQVRKPEIVKDRVCLLVDDVLTTGATLNVCRNTLLSAGASEVFGIALARD